MPLSNKIAVVGLRASRVHHEEYMKRDERVAEDNSRDTEERLAAAMRCPAHAIKLILAQEEYTKRKKEEGLCLHERLGRSHDDDFTLGEDGETEEDHQSKRERVRSLVHRHKERKNFTYSEDKELQATTAVDKEALEEDK